jgi:hypothetical protein
VDFTVYLPDEIGQRVKDEGLKISRLLRKAVLEEFARRDGFAKLLEPGAEVYELELEDEAGSPYVGRIKGRRIAGDEETGIYATTEYAMQQGKKTILFGTDGTNSPSQFHIPGTYISTFGPDISTSTNPLDKAVVALGTHPGGIHVGRLIGYQSESFGNGYGMYEVLNDPPEDLSEKADPYVGLLPEGEKLRVWATLGIVQVIDL